MNRARGFAIVGGALGAAAALILAKFLKPFLPVPSGGVGFVTVHGIPKAVDTVRFLLLLALMPMGAWIGRVLTPGPSPAPPHPSLSLEGEGGTPKRSEGGPGEGARGGPQAGVRTSSRARLLLVCLLFLALRFLYSSGIHGGVDLFHAGHYLSPAADVLSGKAFFRDALPFHGLLTDGGLDAAAFRSFGETLAVARALRIALDLLFFAVALAVLRSLLGSAGAACAGLALLALLASAFRLDGSFPYFRSLPLLLSAFFAARAARTGRAGFAAAAGGAAGLGIFWSLDTGLFAAAALAAWLVLERVFSRSLDGRLPAAAAAGAAIGILPGAAFLLSRHALGAFVRDSLTVVRSSDAIWALPAPAAGDLWRSLRAGPIGFLAGEPLHFFLPVLFFGSVAAWLVLRWRDRAFGERERVALALLVFSVAGYRTALGRSSYSHTRFSMVVPAVLLAFLLATSGIDVRTLGFGARASAVAVLAAFAVYAEFLPAASHAWATARGFGPRWRGAGLAAVSLPRWGVARTTAEQASSLEGLARFADARLAPGETFYDFSNAAALYFFLARPDPTRIYEASCLSAGDFEREAIADLARAKPGFVVVSSPGQQEFDGVPNEVRAPKMAAWIRANYPREMNVGGFGIRVP